MRIVTISDTHYTDERLELINVPEGDVLIHAGDATFQGKPGETGRFFQWMNKQPHRLKLFVPGNHDYFFEHQTFPSDTVRTIINNRYVFRMYGVTYEVLAMSWVKELPLWAFNSSEEEVEKWLSRHTEHPLDILVTHMPPYGIMDMYKARHINQDGTRIEGGELLGSKSLRAFIDRREPTLHVFGHIHEGHGLKQHGRTTCINAAMLNEAYEPTYDPIVVDWLEDGIVPISGF